MRSSRPEGSIDIMNLPLDYSAWLLDSGEFDAPSGDPGVDAPTVLLHDREQAWSSVGYHAFQDRGELFLTAQWLLAGRIRNELIQQVCTGNGNVRLADCRLIAAHYHHFLLRPLVLRTHRAQWELAFHSGSSKAPFVQGGRDR